MYPIHELANIVAMANDREQLALTSDIAENGQNEPAVLWQGQIVDGRCRQLACETLGIDLEVRELSNDLTIDEVRKIVKSLNTRRNLTMTQKIVSAYYQQVTTLETNVSISKQWAVSERSLKNCKYVAKYHPEFMEALFNGSTVEILDVATSLMVTTNKINTLARLVKKEVEDGCVVADTSEEVGFTVDGLIKTEAGKDYYYGLVKKLGITDVAVRMLLVELTNLKFKVE